MKPGLTFVSCLLPVLLHAQEAPDRAPVEPKTLPAPDQTVAPAEPAIEKLPDGRMKLGRIEFDPETRSIRFPAWVNQKEGLLEFLIVHKNGKVHESLLATEISAVNLNIALKLLHYKASRELYQKVKDDGSLSSEFESATDEEKTGSRLKILLQAGTGEPVPANEWISHLPTEKTMPADPWIYGGSFINQGRFMAESSGDLFAIFLSNSSLVNFSGKDNLDDEVWLPHPTRVPELETPVTVIIQPYDS
ncbi:YdjY domain-containing protein [Haloferula sargassicola]|uniref:Secreted protein n=1 Tax=Haloferula sargassicola TaxID=490096 RepID=A0ABP9UUQ0_9BACT